ALAAAQDIGTSQPSGVDALAYATSNGVSSGEVVANRAATSLSTNDSWTVTVRRTVPLAFAPVLGVRSGAVVATATAINSPAKGMDSSELLPYAVWDGNQDEQLTPGTRVTYRSNSWADDNVLPSPPSSQTNPNWEVGDNRFKGYLHDFHGFVHQGDLLEASAKGGDDTGQEDPYIATICQLAASGSPGIFPLMGTAAQNGGDIEFTVLGFIAVVPDDLSACHGGKDMSEPFTGTFEGDAFFAGAEPGGTSVPGTPTVHVLKLWL
ncbi:MAG: hypothetical protein ACYDAG_17615, partial [Chloroflexota bacterium]